MAKEILPHGEYVVKVVGPGRSWDFDDKKDGSKIYMQTDSIQFEGHEQYWVDVNRAAKSDAPKVGATMTGKIEQDEAAKYPPKFVKDKKGGGWSGGGGQASPGAIWSSAVATASTIVAGYYAASGTKPKNFGEFFQKVEAVAPKVNEMVNKLAGTKVEPEKVNTEAGETAGAAPDKPTAAATPKADVVISDISDEDLEGNW